jgi:FAD/FMN-containing dehydrogenase
LPRNCNFFRKHFIHRQVFGLAAPPGISSTTGASGLTLGGGSVWLSREYRMSGDNLISADVVTADAHDEHFSDIKLISLRVENRVFQPPNLRARDCVTARHFPDMQASAARIRVRFSPVDSARKQLDRREFGNCLGRIAIVCALRVGCAQKGKRPQVPYGCQQNRHHR